MKKAFAAAAIIAAALILTGALLCGCALRAGFGDTAGDKGLWNAGGRKYRSVEYPITEGFTAIDARTVCADLLLVRAEDGKCSVKCFEREDELHTVKVEGDTLVIEAEQTRDRFGFDFGFDNSKPAVMVLLPESVYGALRFDTETGDAVIQEGFTFESLTVTGNTGDVHCAADVTGSADITMSTGDVELKGMQAGSIRIELTTGDVELENVSTGGDISVTVSTGDIDLENVSAAGTVTLKCTTGETELENVSAGALVSEGSTGSIQLERTEVAGTMEIRRTTGDVRFENCDAEKVTVVTTTGDVNGTFRTAKVFYTDTDTGSVSVPKSTEGGLCDVTTSTGDIRLGIGER